MITERLIPKLQSRFADRSMRLGAEDGAAVVFPAAHPEVGSAEVYEQNEELVLVLGKFTHVHFANYDRGIPVSERAERIAEDIVAFLEELFADRIELFGSHTGAGGYRRRRKKPRGFISQWIFGKRTYVWSGPLA